MGDLERLQDIQRKRDATNRDWQKVILRKVGDTDQWPTETRQLWFRIHQKMISSPEYRNMLLLVRMMTRLEDLLYLQKQKHLSRCTYEKLLDEIHLDTAGCVVEPFEDLADRESREQRQKQWYDSMYVEEEYRSW